MERCSLIRMSSGHSVRCPSLRFRVEDEMVVFVAMKYNFFEKFKFELKGKFALEIQSTYLWR
jgi:hypothetical protein